MAHAYRARPTPSRAAIFTRPRTVICLLGLCLSIAAIAYAFESRQMQATSNARTFATIRALIISGMSRTQCYRILRAGGLTAVNPAYSEWRKNRFGVWYESDPGAWPRPGEVPRPQAMTQPLNPGHPEVMVKFTTAQPGGCGMATIGQILFDRYDRVKHVVYGQAYWTCSS